ncbi:MAG: CCA tRNA nucleotidyltransferase [Acidobacteria bacterium]|nr:CCA tRNA nucleotidyltransferase [Acidobacteriota bacterium]
MTAHELAIDITKTLHRAGQAAYLAGGCVRDMLLGREPKDFDVVTDAPPGRVRELFSDALAVGAQFGVMLVRREGVQVEIATFRSDHAYLDGRRPSGVTFTSSAEQAVRRRDFTINGLLLDPASGQVLDLVGGRADLEARLVRAIGDPAERFAEDRLRMLRAIRFAARFGFAIEPATLAAIQQQRAAIDGVATERVREELVRILTEGGARRGMELLDEAGLLARLLPEICAMKGVPQPPEFHPEGDVWIHTLLMLEMLREPSPTLALGVLLHDVGKPPTFRVAERIRFDGHVEVGAKMAEEICTRLRFSRRQIDQIVALVANHLRFKDADRMRPSTLKRFLRLEAFEEHLELHRLDCLSSHRNLENYEVVLRAWRSLPEEEIRPARLLTGDDLIAAGYQPGPLFQKMLETVEEAQLEGRITSSAEALALVRAQFPAGAAEGPGSSTGGEDHP